MDPRLLTYYNRELQYLREAGADFAREFPKIAARLGIEGIDCADPYVERLLEGFSFLAARVHLKLDSEFPDFTQHLLETVFPHYLAPTPAMAIVEFRPDPDEGSLAGGFLVPRDSSLTSDLVEGAQSRCEFRTAHDVMLWPIEVEEAEYLPSKGALALKQIGDVAGARAAVRVRLRATAGLTIAATGLDSLDLHLTGPDQIPFRLFEQLSGDAIEVLARPADETGKDVILGRDALAPRGYSKDEAALPFTRRSFQGYRLLAEYFLLPQRFLFAGLSGLSRIVRRCETQAMDIIVLLKRSDPELERMLSKDNFRLYCSPAVNLFPKHADRIHLDQGRNEYHVVADRTRPMDYEVHSVESAVGYGAGGETALDFLPLYAVSDATRGSGQFAYFTVERRPRLPSSRQKLRGGRSDYLGTEVFVNLVDSSGALAHSKLRQLGLKVLCTNRDLPLHMSTGQKDSDFELESGAPLRSIRCIAGPTRPRPVPPAGDNSWRLISHLSLNYLSLLERDDNEEGAAALRELLSLYADTADASLRTQLDGLRVVRSRAVVRRLPFAGPICFGRGLDIELVCDESCFEGSSAFLLGAVLERFFARYVSVNSFTQTRLTSTERGEIMQWLPRIGQRHLA